MKLVDFSFTVTSKSGKYFVRKCIQIEGNDYFGVSGYPGLNTHSELIMIEFFQLTSIDIIDVREDLIRSIRMDVSS